MRSRLNRTQVMVRQHYQYLLIIFVSITAWLITYSHHLVTAYNDAMSHLDIPRLVVDNIQPGLAQLGGVWLPLNHILYLPLIWNNWAWHSGFAGSFISMIAYVLATIGVYKLVYELVPNKFSSSIAAIAFALNPNLLYLQSTPLTEPLYLALLVGSSLFLIRYLIHNDYKYLVLAAVLTALQILARYDGWFMLGVESAALLVNELYVRRLSLSKTIGNILLFITPSLIAMILWFLWNFLIFGNALYSFTGPYSAHAQQATIQAHGGLIAKGNIIESVKAFTLDAVDNIGIIVVALSIVGWIYYGLLSKTSKPLLKLLIAGVLLGDIVFNIVALFVGFSILNIPALHWDPTHSVSGEYFNVRYGITALPFIAVGVGLLTARAAQAKRKIVIALIGLVIVFQGAYLIHSGLITVKDGTIGSSAFVNQDISTALKHDVSKNQKVIMSTSTYNGVMFESGLNTSQFIHEGVSAEWKAAIANPTPYAKWVVMANGNVGDPVYSSLIVKEKGIFLRSYKLVYSGAHANLYERLAPFDQYVSSRGTQLELANKPLQLQGANSYDLAYQSDIQINSTLATLADNHVNVVRFWMFGDGLTDGFQPTPGSINQSMLVKTDYILATARKYQIHVIPTLINNFDDYGGVSQYLDWVGVNPADHDQFFNNQQAILLYENYIDHIVSHQNSITGVAYKNDPTILAWDIMNEPRAANPQVIASWTNTIASYLREQDNNHLITISLDKPTTETGLQSICASKDIGFCSVHIYPQEAGIDSYQSLAQEKLALQSDKNIANSLSKPIVVTETGTDKATMPWNENPLSVLQQTISAIDADNYSGWVIWNYSETPDTSFGFSPNGNDGYNLNSLNNLTSEK
jgi:hypothetical protein